MLGLLLTFILTLVNKLQEIRWWLFIGASELAMELIIFAVWLN